jgi:hypothetical protein
MQTTTKWIIGVCVIVIGAAGFAYFRPDTLFRDVRVDDALPIAATSPATPVTGATVAPTATPIPERSGQFVSREHPTAGVARIVGAGTAQQLLRFDNLQTDNGPDLVVYLTTASDGTVTEGQYLDLGALKGNQGNQNYVIPADVDTTKYQAAVIWCRRFSVAFGFAPLR